MWASSGPTRRCGLWRAVISRCYAGKVVQAANATSGVMHCSTAQHSTAPDSTARQNAQFAASYLARQPPCPLASGARGAFRGARGGSKRLQDVAAKWLGGGERVRLQALVSSAVSPTLSSRTVHLPCLHFATTRTHIDWAAGAGGLCDSIQPRAKGASGALDRVDSLGVWAVGTGRAGL